MVCPSTHRPVTLTVSHHAKMYFLATVSTKQTTISVDIHQFDQVKEKCSQWLVHGVFRKQSLYIFLMDRILFCIL